MYSESSWNKKELEELEFVMLVFHFRWNNLKHILFNIWTDFTWNVKTEYSSIVLKSVC